MDRKIPKYDTAVPTVTKNNLENSKELVYQTLLVLTEHVGLHTVREMSQRTFGDDANAVQEGKPGAWAMLVQQQDFCQACQMPFEFDRNPKMVNSACGHSACRACVRARTKGSCNDSCHLCNKQTEILVSDNYGSMIC